MAAKDLYEKDFYKTLGVDKKAAADEIKKKYRFVPGTGEFNSVSGKELWDDPKVVKRFQKR